MKALRDGDVHAVSVYTHSDRIQNFATEKSVVIVQSGTKNAQALNDQVGFSGLTVAAVDTTDGLRVTLSDNSIFHLRPSGNASELRCYAEAQSHEQAIVNQVLAKVQQL
ncbi:hypothetical protein [Vibrio cholerae]|uniref:hypothetical protein n=1 Tax=Vibrio cholerae TaxID=666 RepID=UPI003080F50D